MNAAARPRPGEAGFSLATLMAALAIMMVLMTAAIPSWRYVMKDMREEELLFRGMQIADAIGRYQQKNAGAMPPSLEVLVKGKYLRKAYKEPFAKDGRWHFIKAGEAQPGGIAVPGARNNVPGAGNTPFATPSPTLGISPAPGNTPSPAPSATPSAGPQTALGPNGEPLGGFVGVASTSDEKSLRLFNGRSKYKEWWFLPPPYPRVKGRQRGMVMPGVGGGGGQTPPPPLVTLPGTQQPPGTQPIPQ